MQNAKCNFANRAVPQADRGQWQLPFTICPNGGNAEQLVTVGEDEIAHAPQILPGGAWLLFTLAKESVARESWDKARIVAHSLESGERRTILEGASDGHYLPTGHLVYAFGGRVYARAFDSAHLAIRGEAVLVVDGVRRTVGAASGAIRRLRIGRPVLCAGRIPHP